MKSRTKSRLWDEQDLVRDFTNGWRLQCLERWSWHTFGESSYNLDIYSFFINAEVPKPLSLKAGQLKSWNEVAMMELSCVWWQCLEVEFAFIDTILDLQICFLSNFFPSRLCPKARLLYLRDSLSNLLQMHLFW